MALTPNRIHFVSRYNDRDNRGYKDLGGGLFSTESWRVSEAAARSVREVWLHDRKDDTAWGGGEVVAAEEVTPSGGRLSKWRFTVRRRTQSGVTWPGDTGGGPEKAYV